MVDDPNVTKFPTQLTGPLKGAKPRYDELADEFMRISNWMKAVVPEMPHPEWVEHLAYEMSVVARDLREDREFDEEK